jgi:hypothetical protein
MLFWFPRSLNDINVLHGSPLFAKLTNGEWPKVNYKIDNHEYTMGYYLVDDIYPSWATLVKTIPEPQGNKRTYFAKAQEEPKYSHNCWIYMKVPSDPGTGSGCRLEGGGE